MTAWNQRSDTGLDLPEHTGKIISKHMAFSASSNNSDVVNFVQGYIFDRMDEWRHLPGYQLERRADLFFSFYLQEALEAKLGFPIRHELIPEFPIRIGTIYPKRLDKNRSVKADYFALSEDGEKAVFVELKTDMLSVSPEQIEYLLKAKNSMDKLLKGLLEIFRASKSKRKYICLLSKLKDMELLQIPTHMKEIMGRTRLNGITEASNDIEIISHVKSCIIVYVQPDTSEESKSKIISFQEFGNIVRKHNDPLSQRFAHSLLEWASNKAGEKPNPIHSRK